MTPSLAIIRFLCRAGILALALAGIVSSAQKAKSDPPDPPAKSAAASATKKEASAPVKANAAESQKLFHRALRLTTSESTLPEAFGLLEESNTLNPTDSATATAKEFVRQELVSEHMERGNTYMEQSQPVDAVAEFRQALALDPSNVYAIQRLRDASAVAPKPYRPPVFDYASEPVLAPTPGKHNFIFRGDSRQLITNVGKAFGIDVDFDGSFSPRPVKVNLEKVDFYTALNIACKLSHCFFIPQSAREMVIANDTQDGRRNLERMSLRTFYLPTEPGTQSLPEISNVLRTLLDLRFITVDAGQSTITIRAPREIVEAAALIIGNMTAGRPQVLLEIRALQLNETASRQIGINYPLQFTLFNLTTELHSLGPNAEALIQRFLAGTLTPADLVAAQALLASGALANSPLLKGFATFGGGIFKSGIVIPPSSLNFHMSHSLFTSLEHVTLRASQGEAATFRVGDRFPVITGTFNSLLNIPGANASRNLAPIIPAFSYEDLGITLKATPQIGASSDVTLQLELAIKALAGVSLNNIPTISNREYKGTITVHDGETTIMAGTIDKSDQRGVSGIPWLSSLPGFGRAFSNTRHDTTSDELILLITPHVLQAKHAPEFRTEMNLTGN